MNIDDKLSREQLVNKLIPFHSKLEEATNELVDANRKVVEAARMVIKLKELAAGTPYVYSLVEYEDFLRGIANEQSEIIGKLWDVGRKLTPVTGHEFKVD